MWRRNRLISCTCRLAVLCCCLLNTKHCEYNTTTDELIYTGVFCIKYQRNKMSSVLRLRCDRLLIDHARRVLEVPIRLTPQVHWRCFGFTIKTVGYRRHYFKAFQQANRRIHIIIQVQFDCRKQVRPRWTGKLRSGYRTRLEQQISWRRISRLYRHATHLDTPIHPGSVANFYSQKEN